MRQNLSQKADTAFGHKLEEHEDQVPRVRRSHGGMREMADVRLISLRTTQCPLTPAYTSDRAVQKSRSRRTLAFEANLTLSAGRGVW